MQQCCESGPLSSQSQIEYRVEYSATVVSAVPHVTVEDTHLPPLVTQLLVSFPHPPILPMKMTESTTRTKSAIAAIIITLTDIP